MSQMSPQDFLQRALLAADARRAAAQTRHLRDSLATQAETGRVLNSDWPREHAPSNGQQSASDVHLPWLRGDTFSAPFRTGRPREHENSQGTVREAPSDFQAAFEGARKQPASCFDLTDEMLKNGSKEVQKGQGRGGGLPGVTRSVDYRGVVLEGAPQTEPCFGAGILFSFTTDETFLPKGCRYSWIDIASREVKWTKFATGGSTPIERGSDPGLSHGPEVDDGYGSTSETNTPEAKFTGKRGRPDGLVDQYKEDNPNIAISALAEVAAAALASGSSCETICVSIAWTIDAYLVIVCDEGEERSYSIAGVQSAVCEVEVCFSCTPPLMLIARSDVKVTGLGIRSKDELGDADRSALAGKIQDKGPPWSNPK